MEWGEQDGDPLEHSQRDKLFIGDEFSSRCAILAMIRLERGPDRTVAVQSNVPFASCTLLNEWG
ncbi:hypothetical protein SAMN04489841_1102 [Natrinema salaciae]|uniref:Uncharacterized protein n=2 Tax=Natrinema salaciae TaxID=1186196 RepID=A0A1H9CPH9_9EURY|nr:hypothetical protein SAMN04489841_1102 [Natrinema salaciae]